MFFSQSNFFFDPIINRTLYNFRPCGISNNLIKSTGNKKVFRSSLIYNNILDCHQLQVLKEKYNIKNIIDLRSNQERKEKLLRFSSFENFHIPLNYKGYNFINKINISPIEYYSYLLTVYRENKNNINYIINLISNSNGNIIFHCSAGIDRTGIISAVYIREHGGNYKHLIKDFCMNFYYVFKGRGYNSLSPVYGDKNFLFIMKQLNQKRIGFIQFIKKHL